MASAIDYLHNHSMQPIIHCDLKPSNVLLDNDMVAHVSDFGLARLLSITHDSSEKQTSTIGIKGSIGYVAPSEHCPLQGLVVPFRDRSSLSGTDRLFRDWSFIVGTDRPS